jgi:hypothetical protein
MRGHDSIQFRNQAAGTLGPFTVKAGGLYNITVSGTTPNVQLNKLAVDNATFVPQGAAISTAGVTSPVYLTPGQYNLVVTGSALYIDVTRVPGE